MTTLPGITASEWSRHPFVARLGRLIEPREGDLECLRRLIESSATIRKHRDLVIDGYEYRKLCFVEEGFAARYKLLRNGKRQILNVLLPGDVVGLPGSFLERANYSVIAVTDIRIHACSIEAYVALSYQRPQFALALSWLAAQEAAHHAEHLINTGRRTPRERLAHFLLEIHSRLETVGRAAESSFDLPFSQEVIADALGLSVPHLNRTLALLRAEGLIAVHGHRVELIDTTGLQALGQFQPLVLTRIPPEHFPERPTPAFRQDAR